MGVGETSTGRGARGRGTGTALARARQEQIVARIREEGSVRVSDLVELLGVSDMTIRRDLDVLEGRGDVEKVHGGAVLRTPSADEPGFEVKQHRALLEKDAIARAAMTLVQPGASIALSAGTTTWALAKMLAAAPWLDLTVVTNSANVWMAFQRVPDHGHRVVLTGGMFRTPSDALVGPIADAAIRSLFVDVLFLGVHGMDPEAGYTTPNLSEAETDRTMISRARRLVVLADHSKWRTIGLSTMAPLSAASVLVTDDGLPSEARAILQDEVDELLIAPTHGRNGEALDLEA
ncbi:MAG TPA: DeoR/GlpR family DNA-binding transcription regulator [Acidimicrobiales bacterium]|nr:DeoR/GlpR family DNA-binding transcription regulator [Acidimicrobiales bacterium]